MKLAESYHRLVVEWSCICIYPSPHTLSDGIVALRIALFGYPVLYDGDREVRLESHKVRALLTYLLHQRGTPVARDYVAYLLWPDTPHEIARKNLRQALYSLRKAFGNLAQFCLDIQRDAVCLHPHPELHVDIWEFEDLSAQTRQHQHRSYGVCPYCYQRFQRMLALYRQDFLAGFHLRQAQPFEEWVAERREYYRQWALKAVRQVVRRAYLSGHYEEAEHWARRWLQWDPWSEEAYAYLIRSLALSGNKHAALQMYRLYVQMMQEEMALEPSEEAQRLAYEVRQNLVTEPESLHILQALPRSTYPLIDRETEKAYLLDLLAQPQTRLLSVLGLGGQGKTRLAEAVAREAVTLFPDGVYWVAFNGAYRESTLLARLHEALDPFLHVARDWDSLYESLRPLRALLVFDDVSEKADTLLEWLHRLLRASRDLVVLATAQHPLQLRMETRFWLRGLRYPEHDVENLTPEEALTYPAVALFVQRAQRASARFALTPETLPAVLDIVRFTQGLPLALELAAAQVAFASCQDVVDTLRRAGLDVTSPHRDQPHQHRSLRVLLEHTWQGLSREFQRSLQKLAMFQGPFDARLAQEVAGVSREQLERLAQYGLLTPLEASSAWPERWEMSPLIRAFVREKTRDDTRSVAEWRQQAHHWLARTLPHLSITQGFHLQRLYPLEEAIPSFIEELLQASSVDQLVNPLVGLITWLRYQGHLAQGLQVLERIEERLEHFPEGQTYYQALGIIRRLQGLLLYYQNQLEESLWTLQEALRLLGRETPNVHYLYTLQVLSSVYEAMGRLDEARYWEKRALELGDTLLAQTQDAQLRRELFIDRANSLNNLASVAFYQGNLEEAEAYYLQARALLTEHEAEFFLVNTLQNLAHVYSLQHRWEEAQQCAEEALRLAQRLGALMAQGYVLTALIHLAVEREDWNTALFLARRAHRLVRRLGVAALQSNVTMYQGVVLAALRRPREAEASFRDAWQLARTSQLPYYQAETALAYARFLMDYNRLSEAERWMREAASLVVTHAFGILQPRALLYASRLWHLQKRQPQALALLLWLKKQTLVRADQVLLERWEKQWYPRPATGSIAREARRMAARMQVHDWIKVVLRSAFIGP